MARKALRILIDLYLAGVAAWAAAWLAWRDRKGVLGLINAWAFWLLAASLPLGAARLGRKAAWPAAAWLAGGSALLLQRYRWPLAMLRGRPQAGPGPRLRVLSLNILKENENADDVLCVIRREAPDVVLIQELEPDMNDRLQAGLEAYAHCEWHCHRRPGGSFGFFSRYPFTVTGTWDTPATRPYSARITLEAPGGPIDVYNVHLQSISPNAIRKTGLSGNFRVREQQMAALAGAMAARPGVPGLALGDYNMTEGNQAYRVAIATLTDAWLAAGRGPGWTWPRSDYPPERPILRLDYCFCTADVQPASMRVLYDRIGSDHCPIVVDVVYGTCSRKNRPVMIEYRTVEER